MKSHLKMKRRTKERLFFKPAGKYHVIEFKCYDQAKYKFRQFPCIIFFLFPLKIEFGYVLLETKQMDRSS